MGEVRGGESPGNWEDFGFLPLGEVEKLNCVAAHEIPPGRAGKALGQKRNPNAPLLKGLGRGKCGWSTLATAARKSKQGGLIECLLCA